MTKELNRRRGAFLPSFLPPSKDFSAAAASELKEARFFFSLLLLLLLLLLLFRPAPGAAPSAQPRAKARARARARATPPPSYSPAERQQTGHRRKGLGARHQVMKGRKEEDAWSLETRQTRRNFLSTLVMFCCASTITMSMYHGAAGRSTSSSSSSSSSH